MVADDGTAGVSDWQAERYDGLPLPHERWSSRLLAGLELRGGETVLDAGCGTGRDTQSLLERLPRGRVVGVDASPAMLARLRQRLPDEPRVLAVLGDLRLLPLRDGAVDAAVSVAALHWLPDHSTVWAQLARVLRPGGVLRTECGGAGNIASIVAVARSLYGDAAVHPWTFADVDETHDRLRAAGFLDIDVRLRADAARLPDGETFRAHLATVVLRGLDTGQVAAVAERLPETVVDYVRLEVRAVRR